MPQAATPVWVTARNSRIHGKGLYARRAIPAGTRILEYVGERITKVEARRREELRLRERAAGGDGCIYLFTLNARHDIDGSVPENLARLINHSCAPNCETRILRGRIWIIAKRDIARGSELNYDYGFPVADWLSHPCRCGAKECAGYIVAKAQRWRLRKRIALAKRAARKAAPCA